MLVHSNRDYTGVQNVSKIGLRDVVKKSIISFERKDKITR